MPILLPDAVGTRVGKIYTEWRPHQDDGIGKSESGIRRYRCERRSLSDHRQTITVDALRQGNNLKPWFCIRTYGGSDKGDRMLCSVEQHGRKIGLRQDHLGPGNVRHYAVHAYGNSFHALQPVIPRLQLGSNCPVTVAKALRIIPTRSIASSASISVKPAMWRKCLCALTVSQPVRGERW